jgi:hypothetical protein
VVPVAPTLREAVPPLTIDVDWGWLVIAGESQVTVTVIVAVALSTAPQALVTATQYAVVSDGVTTSVTVVANGVVVSPV